MVSVNEAGEALVRLGARLRAARIERDEPMAVFAERIGVSVPTLRAMERGSATVQIGFWMKAFWALDRIGELAFGEADAQGRYEAEFRYVGEWLRDERAFPIDPESLKLYPGVYRSANLRPPLGVFEDALPDEWGRKLLAAAAELPRGQQTEPFLLRALGSDGLGALRFAETGAPTPRRQPGSVIDLKSLVDAAAKFEAGKAVENAAFRRLLEAGSSPGGARPKALVDEGERRWIAKFPSRNRDGRFDVVGLEAAALALAATCGLEVPEAKLVPLGRRKALLVRRFDVTPEGGRRHMISLKTLCRET